MIEQLERIKANLENAIDSTHASSDDFVKYCDNHMKIIMGCIHKTNMTAERLKGME